MDTRDDDIDVAFIDVAVKQGRIESALGARVLAFARLKRKPVTQVLVELGILSARRVEKTVRLARYRVARAEDRIFAAVAVQLRLLTKAGAESTLKRQKELYNAGRGFLRFLALLRADGRITHEQDRKVRLEARRSKLRSRPLVAKTLLADEQSPQLGIAHMKKLDAEAKKTTKKVQPARPSGSGSTYTRIAAALA